LETGNNPAGLKRWMFVYVEQSPAMNRQTASASHAAYNQTGPVRFQTLHDEVQIGEA